MSPDEGRRIAVVGAGPAGLYAVQAATALPDVTGIDVFDALPAPYGLVRYGVAADHAKTKTVVRVFRQLFESGTVRFFGNVTVGTDINRADLLAHYDAVIYATGARHDRALGVPGDHLAGSHGAAEMVSWYSGHPESSGPPPLRLGTSAAVIGAGNVALDIVRILAKNADSLIDTDMPDDVIAVLRDSTITDIHLIARRGPAQAKFTPVELRELGDLADADILVEDVDLDLDASSRQEADSVRRVGTNVKVMTGWVGRPPMGRPRRIHLRFWSSPVELLGSDHVTGLVLRRSRPGSVAVTETLDVQLVIRAIGYEARAIPGLPFDADRCVVPNVEGRVVDGSLVLAGEYVAGWLKRGPSGVIGTNRSDAAETVRGLAADLSALPGRKIVDPDAVVGLLVERGVRFVDWEAWLRLESHEAALGVARGAVTVKLSDRAAMLAVCHP